MPAGVYSFDIFAREYDDVASETRELLDETGFKTPYATWVAELDSWIAVDEEGNAELRVKYMFTDDYDRGAVGDAHVTVLGPDLKELAVVDVPTATGVLHGGEDLDEDGEADGIAVYDIPDWSDASEFWLRHDQGEYCIAQGARDDGEAGKKDPGNGQKVKRLVFYSANYGSDEPNRGTARSCIEHARSAQTAAHVKQWSVYPDAAPIAAWKLREALASADIVYMPIHHSVGSGVATWNPCWDRNRHVIVTTKEILKDLNPNHKYECWALFGEYVEEEDGTTIAVDKYGKADDAYSACDFAFFLGCRTNAGADSMCQMLRTRGGVGNVLGTTRKLDYRLAKLYGNFFWDEFSSDAHREKWTQPGQGTPSRLLQCATAAHEKFWEVNDPAPFIVHDWFKASEYLAHSRPPEPDDLDPDENLKSAVFIKFNSTEL